MIGDLTALLTLMKSQPLAYNKDNQEDKEPLFDAVDTLRDCLTALKGLIPAIESRNVSACGEAAAAGFATATDLADYLVRLDVPFRDAHEIVGRSVGFALSKGVDLALLSLEELKQFAGDQIEADVFDVLTVEGSVKARNHIGGTAPDQVRAAVKRGRSRLRA